MTFMTIGEFGERTRLSPKALRLYEQLGLVVPVEVDPASGYRRYSEDQVEGARLVGLLRRLDMPLALISSMLVMAPTDAAEAVTAYCQQQEAVVAERRALASYLRARLMGERPKMYEIDVRTLPARKVLSINRHVLIGDTDAFFDDSFTRLRAAAPGMEGIAGVPFLVFYGEVSVDSDGPVELCRPVAFDTTVEAVAGSPDMQLRTEPAHDEASIHLSLEEMSWPAMLPAYDALGLWVKENGRLPGGPVRQLLLADQRSATPDTVTCDLSAPLKERGHGPEAQAEAVG
jgi:DNA-binding transcriptional MerR regulator